MMSLVFKTCVVLISIHMVLHHQISTAEFLDVNDPKLLEIREHILTAYFRHRPSPVNQCTQERHLAAVKLYTRVVSAGEQEDMLMDMQASIVSGQDDYFIGLPETISAIASSKIKYLLFWEHLMINSATYRNPLSGRTISLHTFFSPSIQIAGNITEAETGCNMELVNCYPFPKWLSKYYRNYAPRLTRLETEMSSSSSRSLFVRMSDGGIGGRFTEVLRFADNKWLMDTYRRSSVRKTILLRGFDKINSNTTFLEEKEDFVDDKDLENFSSDGFIANITNACRVTQDALSASATTLSFSPAYFMITISPLALRSWFSN